MRIAIIGHGRMGREIERLAAERGISVAAVIDRSSEERGCAVARDSLNGADVALEFTEPGSAIANALACIAAGVPVVVGTTGWFEQLPMVLAEVTRQRGALLWAANFSLGVNVLSELVRLGASLLARAPQFDAHIVETHHTAKKDAPSGTALMLQRVAIGALGRQVPITSIRTGSVPGEHDVVFDGPFEQITLSHLARDRRAFADGALTAAHWLRGREGVFTIADVLGTREAGK